MKHLGKYQQAFDAAHYRLAVDHDRCCRTCRNVAYIDGRDRRYYRCGVIGNNRESYTGLNRICDLWAARSE